MTRRAYALIGAAALLGLAVRVAYVFLQSSFHLVDATFDAADAQLYLAIAHSIADGHGMMFQGHPTAYVGPSYPIFLSVLVALGASTTAIGLVQAVLGAATSAVGAGLAWELATGTRRDALVAKRAAAVAAFGTAIYPHFVFWTGYVITETFFVFIAALSFYLALVAFRRSDPRMATLAGLLAAAAALARPAYLAFAVLLVGWWLLQSRRGRPILAALAFAGGLALPMAVWTARNARELGAPILTTTESGFVFYSGNARTGTGGSRGYLDGLDYPPLDVPSGLTEPQADAFYQQEALRQIAEDPGAALRKWPSKVFNMWRPTYEGSSPRNFAISVLSYLPVLVLGIVSAARLARLGGVGVLPALFLASWAVIHMVIAGLIRYRLPAELILVVTASILIVELWPTLARYAASSRSGISPGTTHRATRDAT